MKQLRTDRVLQAIEVLGRAKLTQVTQAADKYAIIRAIRALTPIAEAYNSFQRETIERLRDTRHEEYLVKFRKMQTEEAQIKAGELKTYTLPLAEMIETARYIKQYDHDADFCLRQERDKMSDVAIDPVAPEVIAQLIGSNDLTVAECALIDEILS